MVDLLLVRRNVYWREETSTLQTQNADVII
jgi:hypothetical protein